MAPIRDGHPTPTPTPTPTSAAAPDPGDRSRGSRGVVLVVMCAGYFLVLLDVTVVNTALPRIGSELGAGLSGLQWVVDGYTVALAALMLAGGTVGDAYGHKRLVLGGLVVLLLASVGCALATGVATLSAFRVLQGIGSAVMLPGTLAVITHAFPGRREQARAVGVWAGIGSSALVLGPLLGGVLTDLVGWRAVFWFNLPVGLLVLPVAIRTVRESRAPVPSRPDLPGLVLGAAFLAAVTFAFIGAGHRGLGAVPAIAAGAAVLLGVAFVRTERRSAAPMLPLSLFRRSWFTAANAVAGVMNLGTVGLLFVLNLYLQDVLGWSAVAAGATLLPLYVPLCALAPLSGRLVARIGPRRPMLAGLVIAGAGLALLVPLAGRSGFWSLLPALLLWGIGLGVLTPAVVTAAVDAVAPARAGLASAVNNTARQAGQALGIAAFGALAGTPGAAGYLAGFRGTAATAAALYLAAAAGVAVLSLRSRPPSRP